MQRSPTHTAFRSRTGRSVAARHRCQLPVNGQRGSGGSAPPSGPVGRIDGAGAAGGTYPVSPRATGPKQPTIASATETPRATSRNGTERI